MRVIINIHSDSIAKTAGWRARAVQINDIKETNLETILKTAVSENGKNIYHMITQKDHLNDDLLLLVNGTAVSGASLSGINVKDNVQIHIINK